MYGSVGCMQSMGVKIVVAILLTLLYWKRKTIFLKFVEAPTYLPYSIKYSFMTSVFCFCGSNVHTYNITSS